MSLDYLVVGAGPAGLQMGHHLAKAGRNFLILEAGPSVGTFFRRYPRHRTLISNNKVHTGTTDPELRLRMDWNSLLSDDPNLLFTRYSPRYFPAADDFVRYLEDFATAHRLPIRFGARVTGIARDGDGPFRVTDAEGRFVEAKRLIVATGVSRPNVPPIPGIETAELYTDVSVDPADFTNQRVLILGKGNSAFETADNLIATAAVIHVAGPHSLKLAWKTHYVGHLRAVNNNFLDTYQLKSQNALIDGHVDAIRKDDEGYAVTIRFVRANEVKKDLRYDRVIVCTGFRFDADIFAEGCRPAMTIQDRFPAQTSRWESVNVPDLFFAGTLMQARDFKVSTCGFIHGYRYSVRALHRLLEQKYEDKPWPHATLRPEPAALMEAVLARVNRSSALWQQFSFLSDVLVAGPDDARYYEEMPLAFVPESPLAREANLFTVTLEYGPHHDAVDPFDVDVTRIAQDDHMRSDEGRYLHPVVRHYRHGALARVHHVTENLENDWTGEDTHRCPLRDFFASALAKRWDEPRAATQRVVPMPPTMVTP